MLTEEITIRVEPALARAYTAMPETERRKLDLLMEMRLQDALRSDHSLEQLMREISRQAQERGLTPEALEAILRD